MPLERTFFTVYMDDPANPEGHTEYRAEVRAADQLESEKHRPPGVSVKDPMHTMYLWAWQAMLRSGQFAGTFAAFKAACISAEKESSEPVDPTRPTVSNDSASP